MKRFLLIFLILAPAVAGRVHSSSIFGQLYYPFTKLHTIGTKYFDIIYSKGSESSAAWLATFADADFEKLNGILKTRINGRIAVVIASDPQMENGFTMPFPYNHIVLLDYQSRSLVNHKEYFRDLFLHELTHAVSLNVKSDFYQGLSRIFGSVSPNYSMPQFMIEGVTVSFESLEGFGRVNDPLVAQGIRQDILEGRFKNLSQATGAYDLYPYGRIYYHYGGYFSAYLQKKYGMEKYDLLWQENGGSFPYTLSFAFDKVYGTNIFDEWTMFRESMRYTRPVDTNIALLDPSCAMARKSGIEDTVVVGDRIIYSDTFNLEVRSYDVRSGKQDGLFDGTGELAVSEDGKTLLVTSMTIVDGVRIKVTRFFDLENRRFLDRRLTDLGYASFFGPDVIAVKSRGHQTDLVRIKQDGSTEVLLKGTESVSWYHPRQLDDERIVLLMTVNGTRQVAMLDVNRSELSALEVEGGYKAGYPVTLSAQDKKVLFSFNDDNSFYKAAVLDGDTLYLQTNNVSGGVFHPMLAGEGIVYAGYFSDGDLLLKYPATLGNWNGVKTRATWKRVNVEPEDGPEKLAELKPSGYNAIPYLLPHFFIPYLTIGKDFIPDSVGFFTLMNDPLYDNSITLIATYNYFKNLLNVSVDWANTSLPVNLRVIGSDSVTYVPALSGYLRKTGASVDLSYTFHYIPLYHNLTVGGRISDHLGSYDNGNPSAYGWDYTFSLPVWTLYFNLSTAVAKERFYDYKGFSVSGFYDYNLNNRVYKTELGAYFYPSFIPLVIRLNAAYSFWKLYSPGGYSATFGSHHYPSFREYASVKSASDYYVGGEAKFPLFDLEIQQGLWLLPLYFNRFYMTAGYRGGLLDAGYFQSVFARAVLITSPLYGGLVPNVNLYFEVFYKINNNEWGIDYNYIIDL